MKITKFQNWLVLREATAIVETFSFSAWQRLQELGLAESGIEAKRIELHTHLISDLIDSEEFTTKLVELGIVILKISIVDIEGYNRKPSIAMAVYNYNPNGYNRKQSIAMAGPAEAFDELSRWLKSQTKAPLQLYQHLEWHHANSPLVMDRWKQAIANSSPFSIGAFSEPYSKL